MGKVLVDRFISHIVDFSVHHVYYTYCCPLIALNVTAGSLRLHHST